MAEIQSPSAQRQDLDVQQAQRKVASLPAAFTDSYRHSLQQLTGWHRLHELDAEEIDASLKVIGTLGHGSLGVVHEVQIEHKTSFVRKRVFLPRRTRTRLWGIVQEEAKVMECLTHVHIVHIIGAYELAAGERDLATLLHDIHEENAPGKHWLRQWFSCLTSALAYIHRAGVRHQDIKPSNIVHVGPRIYFTDFSSSAQFDPDSTTSTEDLARASAMYSPLELLNRFGASPHNQRHGTGSDIFSLGCVFIEMLIVLSGSSALDLRDYLELHGSSATRPFYAYYTESIHDYFKIRCNEELYELYGRVIRPMLLSDRKRRPSAQWLLGTLLELAFLPSSCGCSPPDLPDARSSVPTVEMMCIMTVSRHPSLLSHRPKTSSTVHEHGSNFDQAMKRTASQTFSISQESAREGERMGTLKEGTPAHYPASQHSHSSSFSRTVQNARPICRRLSSSSPRRPSVSLAETLVFERKPSTAIFHPRLHLQYQDSGIPTPAQSESSLPQPTAALSLSSSSPSPTLPGLHSKLSALSFKPSPLSGQPHQNQHDSV